MSNKKVQGRRHNMLKDFVGVLRYLESIEGIEKIHTGRFTDKGLKDGRGNYSIKYYNETTRTMKVEFRNRQKTQGFFLEVEPARREYVESQLCFVSQFM